MIDGDARTETEATLRRLEERAEWVGAETARRADRERRKER